MAKKILYYEGLSHYDQRMKGWVENGLEDTIIGEDVVDSETVPEIQTLGRDELKKDLFIDLWKSLYEGCDYDKKTDTFKITYNENVVLHSLSFEDALLMYKYGTWDSRYVLKRRQSIANTLHPQIKGTIPSVTPIKYDRSYDKLFLEWTTSSLKVIQYGTPLTLQNEYVGVFDFEEDISFILPNVSAILDYITPAKDNLRIGFNLDGYCLNLTTLRIAKLKFSLRLNTLSKLDVHTFRFMINNAVNTAPITITVHRNIYDALTGPIAEDTFNGGTQAEWWQLNKDAKAKQITFATI